LPKLPVVTGPELIRALERVGFEFLRQRGSHVTLVHRRRRVTVAVPVHKGKDLPVGTLRTIIREAGVSAAELRKLLG
jgi:predicted RNA binding protein YcfA (HicA-like mRNA interferase family)